MTRNAHHDNTAASSEAARMPSFALTKSSPSKVMSAISSETVNPIPATVAAPNNDGHETVSGKPPNRAANAVAPVIPTNLPTTRPTTIPSVIVEEAASRNPPALISTPALASANRGTTTKLVQGWNKGWSRSFGETVWASVWPVTHRPLTSAAANSRTRHLKRHEPPRCMNDIRNTFFQFAL
jgi:hypothetical protein